MKLRPRLGLTLLLAGVLGSVIFAIDGRGDDDPFGGGGGEGFDSGGFGGEFGGGGFGGFDAQAEPAREALRDIAEAAPEPEQPIVWAGGNPRTEDRIQHALSTQLSEVGLDFVDTPLEEVIYFLRDEYAINIQADYQALDELGIDPEEPITCNLRNVTLRSALRLMLKQLELTHIIADEVLLVTTEEEAETFLYVAVYPVGDLLNEDAGLDDIADILHATVAMDSWGVNSGGEGAIRPLAPGVLVVSQTQHVHAEILATLNAIRRASQLPQAVAAEGAKRPAEPEGGGGGGGGGFGGGRGGGQF